MADPFSSQKFGEGGSAGGRTPGGAGSGGPDPRAVAGSRLRGWAAGDRGQIRAADVGGRWRAPSRRARAGAAVCGCTRQRGSRIAARLPDVPEHHGQGPGPGPAVRRGAAQQSLGPAALLGSLSLSRCEASCLRFMQTTHSRSWRTRCSWTRLLTAKRRLNDGNDGNLCGRWTTRSSSR